MRFYDRPTDAVLRRPVDLELHAPIAVVHQRLRLDESGRS